MARPRKNTTVTFVVTLAFALLAYGLKILEEKGEDRPPGAGGQRTGASRVDGKEVGNGFRELSSCRLVGDRGNDGDSFRLEHGGGQTVVRLYFVDCPEKRRHQYNGERIHKQAQYFNGISDEAAIGVGKEAKKFTLDLLGAQSFTVLTRGERVFDSERIYGFVRFDSGRYAGRYLSELLVEGGLGRIHTKGADFPDGTTRKNFKKKLKRLEGQARRERRGAWGQN